MGVNLVRERFSDWLEHYGPDSRADYLAKLEHHVGQKIDIDAWQVEDTDFPRVGSYTTYGIFVWCLQYITQGDYEQELVENEGLEMEVLREFRKTLTPAILNTPFVDHFLGTGDTDTIFIPVLFAAPFVYDDRYVASLPGGIAVLEAFAKQLQFDLSADPDEEYETENGQWLPVATAKNVARVLHHFFTEKPNACVALS